MRFSTNRRSIRSLAVAASIAGGALVPNVAGAQQLDYTRTQFVHGYLNTSAIWTTPYSSLDGQSTIAFLGGSIDLGTPQAKTYGDVPLATQANTLASTLASNQVREVLVGESMGALTARWTYLFHPDQRPNIAAIVAVSAPHQGAILADSVNTLIAFFKDATRRINDAVDAVKLAAIVSVSIKDLFPISVVAAVKAQNLPTIPLSLLNVDSYSNSQGLPDLRTASSTIAALNSNTDDAAIPRSNVFGTIPIQHAVARLAASGSLQSEAGLINTVDKARAGFRACKWIGYATIIASPVARKCSWADKVIGRVDERWARYTNGTQQVNFPVVGPVTVAKALPFDGVVPNERQAYPGSTGSLTNLLPVDGATHLSIYRTRAGVNAIASAMLAVGNGPEWSGA